jgi:hypothetical protein
MDTQHSSTVATAQSSELQQRRLRTRLQSNPHLNISTKATGIAAHQQRSQANGISEIKQTSVEHTPSTQRRQEAAGIEHI